MEPFGLVFCNSNNVLFFSFQGQEEMYAIFTAKQAEITYKRKKIELLEQKLIFDGYDREDALCDGKDHLTKNMLELLCTRMVHIYLNIQQPKKEILISIMILLIILQLHQEKSQKIF